MHSDDRSAYNELIGEVLKQSARNASHTILSESDGNSLYLNGSQIKLKLVTETHSRTIGEIVDDKIVLTRSYNRHLHRKTMSYGINYMMIKSLPHIKTIILNDERGRWAIYTDEVRTCPCLYFKKSADGNAYELQYFVPVGLFAKIK